jgi:hypothetical protein
MAKTVVINNFGGGLAEDVRELKTNTFSTCKNFDSTTRENRLTPYGELEAEALSSGDIKDKLITDVVRDTSGSIYAIGRNGSGTPTVINLFAKDSSTDISSTYTSYSTLAAGYIHRPNSIVEFMGKFYLIDANHQVRRFTPPSTWTNIGSIPSVVGSSWTNEPIARPFVHPLKKYLYFSVAQDFARVNDSGTFANLTSLVLPTSQLTTSFCDYGSYLAIATAPVIPNNRSTVYLWDMAEDKTFQESIDWGEGSLMILENVGGTLIGVSISDASYTNLITYTTVKTKKITVRALQGNQAVIVKEFVVDSNIALRNFKTVVNGRLYFGCDYDDSLYVLYKNRIGNTIVSKAHYMNNGSAITTLRGISIIGDYLFVAFDTAGVSGNFYRTKVTPTYSTSSYYETIINPAMDLGDRTKFKKLKAVSVAKHSTTGTITVYYSTDGGTTYTALGSNLSDLVNKMTNESDGKPLKDAYEYRFKVASDSGAEITELKYSYETIEELI